jgi:hypothetical protein
MGSWQSPAISYKVWVLINSLLKKKKKTTQAIFHCFSIPLPIITPAQEYPWAGGVWGMEGVKTWAKHPSLSPQGGLKTLGNQITEMAQAGKLQSWQKKTVESLPPTLKKTVDGTWQHGYRNLCRQTETKSGEGILLPQGPPNRDNLVGKGEVRMIPASLVG